MIDEETVWAHLDGLAKPRRSLGRLEALAVRLAIIQQRIDIAVRPRRMLLFAGDHGVVAQGVSAWPSAVTGLMVETIAAGRATSNALAAAHGCDLRLVDMGCAAPPPADPPSFYRAVRIADGTDDLSSGPAMTVEAFERAWAVGAEEARAAADAGCSLLIAGEMGIGNTTPAACLTALLAGAAIEEAVGRGAGADDAALDLKRRIVGEAVAAARPLLVGDPLGAIARVGGLEIAAMAGFFAEGAARGRTLLLDGYVATAAALIAERLRPGTARAMIAAHRSAEPGHRAALAALELEPLLEWDMRLGEGTGALVALPLLDSAAALLKDVARLSDLGVARED
ncbi:nicotinate-nucleotide--dimethylbenzimidazole phosphoribosyltransferase [Sphingomonas oleivorans]|uniref:Nicotinate-nucleotide--dimethylbenzimidazole phosphoribosyltransferase n=1 Tax=Sphingomonas oleivorans TaxID=1735121 RepID=A0A2T5G2C9_9SPHN|nr:nicotinate-nucleotide--dimethylbenzimidazole phosphoribosyltransferase [Sphingomonas oleivorans]PTQ13261.1 nicotinate-nucleotide--dimethylbenzimidazole phosphoribosyltransferase [Sphingomonas oleivorans]